MSTTPTPKQRRDRNDQADQVRLRQSHGVGIIPTRVAGKQPKPSRKSRRDRQPQAVDLRCVSHPRISDVVRGEIDKFTIDALVDMLGRFPGGRLP